MERIVGGAALDRGIALLVALVDDGAARPLREVAAGLGLPASTARRMAAILARRGVLLAAGGGRFVAGPALAGDDAAAHARLLAAAARPVLRGLARDLSLTAHLGVLDEAMVTYLAKEGGRARPIFTREDRQLEAYCSAVGKVLLAGLPAAAREAYLAADAFVALTPRTITSAARLRDELARVAARGHAVDDEEVAAGLYCVGVPVVDRAGTVAAALSVSGAKARFARLGTARVLARLDRAANAIAARRYP